MSFRVMNRGDFARRILVALVAVSCVKAWIGPAPLTPVAHAQVFDSAAQRKKILQAEQRTNALLVEIRDILKSGTLKVRVESADKTQAGAGKRPPSKK